MYLKSILFSIVTFYNNYGTVHLLDINYIQYIFIYIFFLSLSPPPRSSTYALLS
jgi:hypothetical protein